MLSILLNVNDDITERLIALCADKMQEYGDILFWLIIGMLIATLYHKYVGTSMLRRAHKENLESKDQTIKGLTAIIEERLKNIQVEKKDRQFFSGIRKFFYETLGKRNTQKK